MLPINEIISYIQILTFLVAVCAGIYLIITSSQSRPSKFIGLFLIAFSTDTILTLLINFELISGREYLYFLPLNFWFLSAVLLYIYARDVTRPLEKHKKLLHIIPGLTEFIVLSVFFILGWSGVIDMSDMTHWSYGLAFYFEAAVVFTLAYYILIIWTVRKTRNALSNEFSNVFGLELKWLELICFMSIFTMLSWVFISYIENPETFNKVKFVVYIFNMLTIGLIIYSAFRQHELGLDREFSSPNITSSESEKEPSLSELQVEQSGAALGEDYRKLEEVMKEKQPYLNPDLKIYDIAHLTGISSRKLSILINAEAGMNFRAFVNSYRIAEAKRLLSSERLKHLNMDGIAKESGFSSRTTFYNTFKKVIGCSPKEYSESS